MYCYFHLTLFYKKCAMEEKVIKNIRPDEHEYLRLQIWDTGYAHQLQSVRLMVSSLKIC